MINTVKVKTLYDKSVKKYRIDDDFILKKDMLCIGVTRFGEDIVEVSCPKREQISLEEWQDSFASKNKDSKISFEPILIRPAKESEISLYHQNQDNIEEIRSLFHEKIQEYKLDLHVAELHFTLNKDRLVFSYTADRRVDFRELVKDLGSRLKHRIEMFQMSVKDPAIGLEGCGSCGRQLCCSIGCSMYLSDKKITNTKSAKFLGVCGRLRCCSFFDDGSNR